MLLTDFSAEVAAKCMNRLAKLSARFIGDRGFSIGIDDVSPAPALQVAKAGLVRDGYASFPATSCHLAILPASDRHHLGFASKQTHYCLRAIGSDST